MASRTRQPAGIATVSNVIFFSVATAFPALLVAALAVPMRADLDFGPGFLGASVAVYFATTSALGRPMGAVARAIGTRRAIVLSGVLASLALVGIAGAHSKVHLVIALAVGGASNALSHPAVNAALSRIVVHSRHGLVFGIKQAAAPMAGLLGGLSVPVIALTLGWRWAFVVAASLVAANGLLHWLRRDPDGTEDPPLSEHREQRSSPRRPLPVLAYAVAAGLGSAGATSIGVFLVDGAVTEVDFSEGNAAALFAVANVAAGGVRVGSGLLIDRQPRHARMGIGLMLALGAVGCALLTSETAPLFVTGALLAAGLGWGWTGVMHYVVVLENADRPEIATGILLTGFAFGSGSGPLLLGQLADHVGYQAVWLAAGSLCVASASVLHATSYVAGRRDLSARSSP